MSTVVNDFISCCLTLLCLYAFYNTFIAKLPLPYNFIYLEILQVVLSRGLLDY